MHRCLLPSSFSTLSSSRPTTSIVKHSATESLPHAAAALQASTQCLWHHYSVHVCCPSNTHERCCRPALQEHCCLRKENKGNTSFHNTHTHHDPNGVMQPRSAAAVLRLHHTQAQCKAAASRLGGCFLHVCLASAARSPQVKTHTQRRTHQHAKHHACTEEGCM